MLTFKEQREFVYNHIYRQLKETDFNIEKTLGGNFLNFSLLLTKNCNATCPYCYQLKQFKQDTQLMSKEIADKTLKFIYSSFENLDIVCSLFGGEPFLNYSVIQYLVENYPMCKFMVTTNGLELLKDSAKIEWIKTKKNNLTFCLSINALKFIYPDYMIRSIPLLDILKYNTGDVHYVLDDPLDKEVIPNLRFLIEYGVNTLRISPPKEQDILITHSKEYIDLYKQIADLFYKETERPIRTNLDYTFRSNIDRLNNGFLLKECISSYCGAGFHYIAIDHRGDIYPCDYFTSFPEWKLGNVETGFISKLRIFKKYPDWYTHLFESCINCPLGDIRLCTGAMCYAENYKVNHDIFKPTKNICTIRTIEKEIYNYISKLNIESKQKLERTRVGLDEKHVVI